MENREQYLLFLSEIVSKMKIVLGPEVAVMKVNKMASFVLDKNGNIIDVKGSLPEATQQLVEIYIGLAGGAVKNIIDQTFEKYPQVKKLN